MNLSAGGFNDYNQLGIAPTTGSKDGHDCVDAVTRVPFDLEGVQCVSAGGYHSVIIKLGHVFAAGSDEYFRIGSDSRQVYKTFTEIKISEEPISWAACGSDFTLYLTVSVKAILCHEEAKGERIHVEVGKKAVSVFAGFHYGGIIDEEGAIHILDKDDPHKPPQRFSFESPAVDLACCSSFVCVLTSDGRVFANGSLNKRQPDFAEVSSLEGKKIEKLSSYDDTCAALTSDGRVFICGMNIFGQLGNGTTTSDYSSFTEVRIEEAIKDVSCSWHTLFLTESNKILGCGYNKYCQLLKKTEKENVLSPIEVMRIEADQLITGLGHSFILSGTGKLENPAKTHFGFLKQEMEKNQNHTTNENKLKASLNLLKIKIEEQRENIDSLTSFCQNQAQTINQLMEICQSQSQSIRELKEVCQNLEQQNETNKQEKQNRHNTYRKEIHKVQESLKNHEQRFDSIDNKLDVVVKYINDLDFF